MGALDMSGTTQLGEDTCPSVIVGGMGGNMCAGVIVAVLDIIGGKGMCAEVGVIVGGVRSGGAADSGAGESGGGK